MNNKNVKWFDENNIAPGHRQCSSVSLSPSKLILTTTRLAYEYGNCMNKRKGQQEVRGHRQGCKRHGSVHDGQPHSATGLRRPLYTNKEGVQFSIRAKTSGAENKADADTYVNKVSDVVVTDPHGNDVTDQFKITTEDGKLTIDKCSVTITAGSAEKEYDGAR